MTTYLPSRLHCKLQRVQQQQRPTLHALRKQETWISVSNVNIQMWDISRNACSDENGTFDEIKLTRSTDVTKFGQNNRLYNKWIIHSFLFHSVNRFDKIWETVEILSNNTLYNKWIIHSFLFHSVNTLLEREKCVLPSRGNYIFFRLSRVKGF